MCLGEGILGGPLSVMFEDIVYEKILLVRTIGKGRVWKGRANQLNMTLVLRFDHHFIKPVEDHGDNWADEARRFTRDN